MMNTKNMVVNGFPMHILTPEEIEERNEMVLDYYKDKPDKYYGCIEMINREEQNNLTYKALIISWVVIVGIWIL